MRPTPDRVRETLFNWLSPFIREARCLDLFAGSGALGFEALSRGAKSIVMLDKSKVVCQQLRKNSDLLSADNAHVYHAFVPRDLSKILKPFDIIFLDPPFHQGLLKPCSTYLEENNFLAEHALIYIEAEDDLIELGIPSQWQLLKKDKAGQVRYYLYQKQ